MPTKRNKSANDSLDLFADLISETPTISVSIATDTAAIPAIDALLRANAETIKRAPRDPEPRPRKKAGRKATGIPIEAVSDDPTAPDEPIARVSSSGKDSDVIGGINNDITYGIGYDLTDKRTSERVQLRSILVRGHNSFPLKKLTVGVEREIARGWLQPYLLEYDSALWGRWDWWIGLSVWLRSCGLLPPEGEIGRADAGNPAAIDAMECWVSQAGPIPPIAYQESPHPQTLKMITQCLDAIPASSGWQSWGSSTYFDYFLDYLLYGFGSPLQPELPKEPHGCEGAGIRLYQLFQLGMMQLFPFDYFGHIMAEAGFGRAIAFYPTPLHICMMMCSMLMGTDDPPLIRYRDQSPERLRDYAKSLLESTNDPCVGTGRFPLALSNYRLRHAACDISRTCVRATSVNLAIYAPWMFAPLFD